MIDRRSFIGLGALALCATGLRGLSAAPCCAAKKCKKVPFKLGVAGYTYNKFSIDETLVFLERLDVHYLCIKNFHLPFDSTPAQIAEFKKKCADHGVTGYGVGPIYMASDEEAKKAFDYAAAIGVKTVVAVPTEQKEIEVDGKKKKVRFHSRARCEYLAGLCKEYDMRIAIHNHGPDIPYCFPTGESAFNMVKDLDARMGLCLDIGHDFRAGHPQVRQPHLRHAHQERQVRPEEEHRRSDAARRHGHVGDRQGARRGELHGLLLARVRARLQGQPRGRGGVHRLLQGPHQGHRGLRRR